MIELGEIRMSARGLRRFLLFQSLTQFLSWVALVALMFAVCDAILVMTGARIPMGLAQCIAPVCGALPSVWLSRQASFRVRGPARAQAWSVIEGHLCARACHPPVVENGVHLFRPRLPRLLRWEEQDVRMVMDREGMLVSGPWAVLRGLRALLAATFAD